jgi:MFS family permease
MNTPPKRDKTPRLLIHVAVVVALGIMGDSLMYSLLPLEAENLGIPLTLVGLLLSANRIVRLFSNTWAGLAFERWGPRPPFIAAAVLALITTAFYETGWGFFVFLLARIGWGIAWSAFRQGGYQAVWAAPEHIKGRLMGLLWGIARLGSAVSVVLGGFLYDQFNYPLAVTAIAIGTALSIPTAVAIRWPQSQPAPEEERTSLLQGLRMSLQTAPRRWILTVGFMDTFFEGILASTLSLYLLSRLGEQIADTVFGIGTLAGVVIAARYISNIVFSPIIGIISDKVGQARMQVILAALTLGGVCGVVFLPGYWIIACLVFVFISCSGMYSTVNAAASGLANQTKRPHLFVSVFSTAIDSGAAIGPLLAFTVGEIAGFEILYILTVTLLLFAAIRFWQSMKV